MPKPNTRFLRNIIKGTDSHNRALLAKEAAESKARLKDLERTKEIQRKKTNPTTRDIRNRQMGDIQAILGGVKRRRTEKDCKENGEDRREADRREARVRERHDDREGSSRKGSDKGRGHRRSDGVPSEDRGEKSRRHHAGRSDDKKSHRSRYDPQSSEDEKRHSSSRKRRERSKSPHKRRSRSPRERSGSDRHSHRQRSRQRHRGTPPRAEGADDGSSSPLEDMIGPVPAPKVRGRGDVAVESGIDRRFSESYDPKTDTQVDDGDEIDGDSSLSHSERQEIRRAHEARAIAAGVVLPRQLG